MLLAIVVAWLFSKWDGISKPTFFMFLVLEEVEETSFDLIIISHKFSRRFCEIYDLDLISLISFYKFIIFSSIEIRSL